RGKRRSPLDLGVCPYVGLRAFAETDAPYFFGREELTQRLLGELERRAALAVVGPSGSGKSSVVRAGLMAQLRQGKRLPGSDRWWLRSFRPGAQPLAALAQCLVDSGTEKEQAYQRLQLEGMLFEGAEGFARWLRSRPEPTVVLVIDQLEELFTLASRTDCQRVMQILLGALEYVSDRFKLVMTLRTDFMATALEVPGLAPILQEASIFVPPHLNDADYRRAIVRPAEAVGLEVEPELVEVVLQDLDRAAGDLPLLEFVLAQLWEARQPGCLTLQVYQREIGGLKGALERKAQAIYDSLDDEARDCTRWIFLSLTQLGEGTEDTRRRTLKSELIVAKYPEPLVERTLQVLTTAKLIVVSAGEDDWQRGIQRSDEAEADRPDRTDDNALDAIAPPEPTVEVAHEALIRHWSTLRWWLEENRSRLRARRQIEAAAQQWKQHGKQSDFLLQGVRLDAAAEVYLEAADELSQDVRAFIEAGLAARDARSEQLRRRLRRARQAIATISLLAVAAVGLGGVAMQQRQRAQLSQIATLHQLSTSHLLAGRGLDGATAALRAGRQVERLWSWGLGAAQRQQVEWQVASALQQSSTFGRDRNRLDGHTRSVNAVSLSPDGSRIASGSDDTTVRLWQTDGTLLHQLDDRAARVTSVAFSPDGKWLATADADGAIWLRQAEDGRPVRALKDRGAWLTQLAFAPDGGRLAAATRDRAVDIWDVESGQVALTLEGHGGWVTDVQFSPAGEVIATASDDGTVKLWSAPDGELLHTSPARNSGGWASVAFSPDGQTLAIASINGAIALWNWDADPESSAAWTEIVSAREADSLTHVLTFNA
ncbi:MAG: WD40 repeat domain-containing protein, partial [Cyanobacteria bacterium P01_E01_bin.48]